MFVSESSPTLIYREGSPTRPLARMSSPKRTVHPRPSISRDLRWARHIHMTNTLMSPTWPATIHGSRPLASTVRCRFAGHPRGMMLGMISAKYRRATRTAAIPDAQTLAVRRSRMYRPPHGPGTTSFASGQRARPVSEIAVTNDNPAAIDALRRMEVVGRTMSHQAPPAAAPAKVAATQKAT